MPPSLTTDWRSSSARSRLEEKPAPTAAPAAARLWEIAAPIPRVPPVTSATRPVRSSPRSAVCGLMPVVVVAIAVCLPLFLVEPLDDHGLAHAAGNAHGLESQAPLDRVEAVEQGGHDPGAAHPERMAPRDRAALRVVRVLVDAELVAAAHQLGREGRVHLDDVDVVDRQPGRLEHRPD